MRSLHKCKWKTHQLLQSAVLLVLFGNQETVVDEILADVILGRRINESYVLGTADAVGRAIRKRI